MKGVVMSDKKGTVNVDLDVIRKYAGLNAIECFGVVGMSKISMKDGLARLLKRESISKGVEARIVNGCIDIDFHIIIAYGLNMVSIATNLMENVAYKVEKFSGVKVRKINVFVEGVRVID